MKISEYKRSRSFCTPLITVSLILTVYNIAPKATLSCFHIESLGVEGTKKFKRSMSHDQHGSFSHSWYKPLKSSSPEPVDRWPSNFVCSIGYTSTTKIAQLMSLVDLDLFKAMAILLSGAFI